MTETNTAEVASVRPLHDGVLVVVQEPGEFSPGGIFLVEAVRETPKTALVIATGPGRWRRDGTREPVAVSSGDTVVFSPFAGTPIEHGGGEYYLLAEGDILAVSEPG